MGEGGKRRVRRGKIRGRGENEGEGGRGGGRRGLRERGRYSNIVLSYL